MTWTRLSACAGTGDMGSTSAKLLRLDCLVGLLAAGEANLEARFFFAEESSVMQAGKLSV